MAKGHKSGGKNFKPGSSGNPEGRPKLPEEIKRARAFTKNEIEQAIHRELRRKHGSGQSKLKRLITAIIDRAILDGDHQRTNFILEQLFGKMPSRVDVLAKFQNELTLKSEAELVEEAKRLISETVGSTS